MKQGDLVVRKSYGGDVLFHVAAFTVNQVVLRGTDYRLLADAPLNDLQIVKNPEEIGGTRRARIQANESLRKLNETRMRQINATAYSAESRDRGHAFFEVPGKVLHLDGDGNYLKKSMQVYSQLKVPAEGVHCHESQMPYMVDRLLPQFHPDIIVITGHDGLLKQRENLYQLSSYKNSLNFVQAVQAAREYERNRDSLIVVAGACQSYFEALLQAGANFASSPARIMIHALDPVYIAVRSAFTPFRETIHMSDVIAHTISGKQGLGGIETLGKYRTGVPNIKQVKINQNVKVL